MANDDSYFNYNYYDPDWQNAPMVPLGDSMANLWEYVISFYHVPTGQAVYFKAFITSFSETYNSNWSEEQVYGRADPIYLYSSTKRGMTLVFDAVAESDGEAYENLGKVGELARFLYPVYTSAPVANTIAQSPLVRLKVMNLVRTMANNEHADAAGEQDDPVEMYKAYVSSKDAQFGLLGAISNINIDHNIQSKESGVVFKGKNTILPKHINVSVTFNPIHEHPLGWQVEGDKSLFGVLGSANHNTWPYGVRLLEPTDPQPPYTPNAPMVPSNQSTNDEAVSDTIPFTEEEWSAGWESAGESTTVPGVDLETGVIIDPVPYDPQQDPLLSDDFKAAIAAGGSMGVMRAAWEIK